jgi:hypothetical protein
MSNIGKSKNLGMGSKKWAGVILGTILILPTEKMDLCQAAMQTS